MEQSSSTNQSPKFAFFYMLSLVALAFMAISTGIIIFQIINKYIVDALATYNTCYSSSSLKFAISAIIISTPIYYVISWQINKNLFSGVLKIESGIRKWLTYFIIFVSSVVALGYLVAIIYNFLDGELSIKFALKAFAALAISGTIFSYYLHEIKRQVAEGVKNKVIRNYFWITLVAVVIVLISGFVFVESPNQIRVRKFDNKILENFDNIKYAVENFYYDSKRLPENLRELVPGLLFADDVIKNITNGKEYDYQILEDNKYKICADFQASNKDVFGNCYEKWFNKEWAHDKGYQCFEKTVFVEKKEDYDAVREDELAPMDGDIIPRPAPTS